MTTPQQGASELTRELLPCPFCGSRAIPHRLVDTAHVIECVECGARGAESGPGHVAKTEREAAALWNRRTTAVAPAVAEPVECEHSPETGRTLPDGGYEWKCDLCGEVLYRATPIKPPAPDPVRCSHEAYQGECVHCGVPFVNGRPKYPPQPAAPPERTEPVTETTLYGVRVGDVGTDGIVVLHCIRSTESEVIVSNQHNCRKGDTVICHAVEAAQPERTAQPIGTSDYCKGAGCVHQQFGCPAWSEGENPFATAQPNWREPLEALAAKWEKNLRAVGGMDNEMLGIPAGGVREMINALRAVVNRAHSR
jgi:Lar family restriction alleviation protein